MNQCKQINKYDVSNHVQYRMRKLKRDGKMRSNTAPSGSVELAQKLCGDAHDWVIKHNIMYAKINRM